MSNSTAQVCVWGGVLVCVLFFSIAYRVDAALLYFDPDTAMLHRGDTITMALRVDTDTEECINTVDATLEYSDAIRAIDVSRGDSILSVWVEDPVIDEENHTVQFAGGIPGGYCGRIAGDPRLSNIIAEIVFRLPGFSVGSSQAQTADIHIADTTQVLRHDGFGTIADLRTQDAKLTLLSSPGPAIEDTWNTRVSDDDVPPSGFSVTLTRDDTAFSGKYYIVFNALDKQSGIDHYEVIEEPFEEFDLFKWGAADAPWVISTSPYVLKDQSLNSTIRVRAIDKAGNETISVLVPDEAMRSLSRQRLIVSIAIGVVVFIVLGGIGYALWRRKKELEGVHEGIEGQTSNDDDHA